MKKLIAIFPWLVSALFSMAQSGNNTNTTGYSGPGAVGLTVLVIVILGGIVGLTLMKKKD